jgi:hypothetical protein
MDAIAQLIMTHIGEVPITPEPLQVLGTMQIVENLNDFDCPVCWNTIVDGDKKIQTSCSHSLCAECVPRLQCLPGTTCVACPMCRTTLQKCSAPEIPLRKVPLNKIRQRLRTQNFVVASYTRQIESAPNEIVYALNRIQNVLFREETARREIGLALQYQAALQEEVNMRARPRQENSSVGTV